MPDPKTAIMDPFTAQPQLILCDVIEPSDGKPYELDPEVPEKAEEYLVNQLEKMFLVQKLNFSFLMMLNGNRPRVYIFQYRFRGRRIQYWFRNGGGNLGHRPKDKGVIFQFHQ